MHWFLGVIYEFLTGKQHEVWLRAHTWIDAWQQLEQFCKYHGLKENRTTTALHSVEADGTYWTGDRFEKPKRPMPDGAKRSESDMPLLGDD
jgi:hypothetical protein